MAVLLLATGLVVGASTAANAGTCTTTDPGNLVLTTTAGGSVEAYCYSFTNPYNGALYVVDWHLTPTTYTFTLTGPASMPGQVNVELLDAAGGPLAMTPGGYLDSDVGSPLGTISGTYAGTLARLHFWDNASAWAVFEVYSAAGALQPVPGGSPSPSPSPPIDTGTDPDSGASCGLNPFCYIKGAFKWGFVPSASTQSGWSTLASGAAGKVPWGYVPEIAGFWNVALDYAAQCGQYVGHCGTDGFGFNYTSSGLFGRAQTGGSVPVLNTASQTDPGVKLLQMVRPLLDVLMWMLMLLPLAFWLFRKLVPAGGGDD